MERMIRLDWTGKGGSCSLEIIVLRPRNSCTFSASLCGIGRASSRRRSVVRVASERCETAELHRGAGGFFFILLRQSFIRIPPLRSRVSWREALSELRSGIRVHRVWAGAPRRNVLIAQMRRLPGRKPDCGFTSVRKHFRQEEAARRSTAPAEGTCGWRFAWRSSLRWSRRGIDVWDSRKRPSLVRPARTGLNQSASQNADVHSANRERIELHMSVLKQCYRYN